MIAPCVCESTYQDKKYGKGMRVHNAAPKSKSSDKMRCTVCGKDK
jgi:hypothetical protein